MRLPSIRPEGCDPTRRCSVGWLPLPCGVRPMVVEVSFEIPELVFKIRGCPEQGAIQALPAEGADQSLHKGVGERNVGHGLDFGHLQDSQIGLPLMKTIKRIMVGVEVFRDGVVASNGVVEHSAKGDTVDRTGLQAKPDDPASVLIHDDQYPVSPQHS